MSSGWAILANAEASMPPLGPGVERRITVERLPSGVPVVVDQRADGQARIFTGELAVALIPADDIGRDG
jgi:hypothetical protein